MPSSHPSLHPCALGCLLTVFSFFLSLSFSHRSFGLSVFCASLFLFRCDVWALARCALGALLSSPCTALDVRLLTALQVLQVLGILEKFLVVCARATRRKCPRLHAKSLSLRHLGRVAASLQVEADGPGVAAAAAELLLDGDPRDGLQPAARGKVERDLLGVVAARDGRALRRDGRHACGEVGEGHTTRAT